MARTARLSTTGLAGIALLALAACDEGGLENFDFDLRGDAQQFDTTAAARNVTAARPTPDDRGVISYPNYQVAVANAGDTVGDVANRVGLPPEDLARFNGLAAGTPLRGGEVLALPSRVSEPSPATGAITTGPITPGSVDITTLAGDAIARSDGAQAAPPSGQEPVRHRVEQGETAFTIARLYNVPVQSLAEWNGLGADYEVREGQFLLIPVTVERAAPAAAATATAAAPGTGSVAPEPPSAATALPQDRAGEERVEAPPPADLGGQQTAASDTARMRMPVAGSIIRPYESGRNDGIGIAASAGAPVTAADAGTVAAITRDTDQVPILVLRHEGNLLTVYAGVQDITVERGDTVSRGQQIAEVRPGEPSFLHFEVREGFESVDPVPYLN